MCRTSEGVYMKSYTIHLIRHGLTKGNTEGRYIGRTDLPLSQEGAAALAKLRSEGEYPMAALYVSSPLKRCTQTLKLLYPGENAVIIDGFSECDFGDWEGKTAAEIAACDENFGKWASGVGEPVTPPGGESGAQFMYRVCSSFEKLVEGMLRSGTQSAVVVTHGGVIMSILSAYGLPKADFYDWMAADGCGYSMRITPGLWMRSMVAEVYGEVPRGLCSSGYEGKAAVDIARKAAADAFGKNKKGKQD